MSIERLKFKKWLDENKLWCLYTKIVKLISTQPLIDLRCMFPCMISEAQQHQFSINCSLPFLFIYRLSVNQRENKFSWQIYYVHLSLKFWVNKGTVKCLKFYDIIFDMALKIFSVNFPLLNLIKKGLNIEINYLES